jgi:hypothetical protein
VGLHGLLDGNRLRRALGFEVAGFRGQSVAEQASVLSGILNIVLEEKMGTILIIILVLLLLGALPTWPYSTGWGYYPSGGLGLILLIVIVLALMGRV